MRTLTLAFLSLFIPVLLPGQIQVVVGGGYWSPTPLFLAPGQVASLYVTGLGTQPPSFANGLPLPTTLGGLSVELVRPSSKEIAWPVEVKWNPPLLYVSPSEPISTITFQMPFDLFVHGVIDPRYGVDSLVAPPYKLGISFPGSLMYSTAVYVVPDSIHVVNACWPALWSGICRDPAVTHADGTRVTSLAPAKPGEVLVMYALGLGKTTPYVPAGEAAPLPAPAVSSPPVLKFDFGSALVPTPFPKNPALPPVGVAPLFAGLTPGFAGLYQINFTVPPVPSGTPGCGGAWNLTVTVQGTTSFDGAGICVQVP
jgi:hypothetical protein